MDQNWKKVKLHHPGKNLETLDLECNHDTERK